MTKAAVLTTDSIYTAGDRDPEGKRAQTYREGYLGKTMGSQEGQMGGLGLHFYGIEVNWP
jgi:hypothetical protein